MMNIWNRKERVRKNQNTDLRSSVMHLRSQECGYISIYELELQHNIFINNNNNNNNNNNKP
jgi:hypothetical protein